MTQSSCLSILRAWMFFISLVLFATTIQPAHGQTATLSPTSRSFGSVAVGSSSGTTTVTLTNTGRAALSVSSITTSGDFTQTNTCGSSVAAARNCVITITFKPTAIGARTGTLTVNDGVGTQTASLTGTGITPITISPASRAFGSVVIGQTSAARTFTITNRETVAMPITVASTNTEFAQTGCGSSLAAGASCTASVTFTPAATATGLQAGQIQVSYTGIGSPQSVSVQGTAVAPLTAQPNPVQFSQCAGRWYAQRAARCHDNQQQPRPPRLRFKAS